MSKQELIESTGRAADIAAPVGWVAWFVSHTQEINSALQTVVLLATIFATVAAGVYHIGKWRRLK